MRISMLMAAAAMVVTTSLPLGYAPVAFAGPSRAKTAPMDNPSPVMCRADGNEPFSGGAFMAGYRASGNTPLTI